MALLIEPYKDWQSPWEVSKGRLQDVGRTCPFRKGNYCNNLATRVIPFFIVLKSSVGEAISKTVPPYFSKNPVA